MKNNIYKFLVLLIALQLYNCNEGSLEDLTTNPEVATVASPTQLLTGIQWDFVSFLHGDTYGQYSGAFIQTFAGSHSTGLEVDRYDIDNNTFASFYADPYTGGLFDANVLINKIGPDNNAPHHIGVAKIMSAHALGTLTDVYGDIPYSEAFDYAKNKNPKLDGQEEIYATINTLLLEAVEDLKKTSTTPLSGDFIHNNEPKRWIATAYLLLARYNNHLSHVDPTGSANKALEYIDKAKAAGFTSNAWNFQAEFPAGNSNWVNSWLTFDENPTLFASQNFMNLLTNVPYVTTDLTGKSKELIEKYPYDPRVFVYFNSRDTDVGFIDFVGFPNGELSSNTFGVSKLGDESFYSKEDSPLLLGTHFELLFIEAEAALRANNKNRAATALNNAIASQMSLVVNHGKDQSFRYLSEDKIEDINRADSDKMIDDAFITYKKLNNTTAVNVNLNKIMTQKYIAMFTMNLETWVDVRRHNYQYPSYLTLPAEAKTTSFIRRIMYPNSARTSNSSFKDIPVNKLTDKLWWNK
ncbi:SusD/RagB family nutrient-binding outer membrane lipoprotein [Tenacibaculum finnmarkense]|uniref:SusD/RagB family nutrient-binding outer membrane lipoprotein n=1 Tax=Tenacibaculum finnmarkense TaxID=2781243 RepID=UPI001E29BE5B|nr:SusD/RagB family nutrient-binding outer membrane lipoprotein [Tenacibaculum finnmarkense]MCD8399073.1 SusD/RagB family nutrient-binding outer membrane lipoprotein [Tenacibaculum finnmarkense genomovar ulcerans]MCG8748449.1 SusD/RagB family nutrient-binding outer membrane lipoprotein [Tenacibaculum finnmarkense]